MIGRTLAILSALVGLSACGASPSTSAPSTPGASEKPSSAASKPLPQPFDVVLGDKIGLIDYAHMKIQFKCLESAGYPQNLQALGTQIHDVFEFLTISEDTWGWTDEAEARYRGFGNDMPATPARIVSFDAGYDTNLERCAKVAEEALGENTKKLVEAYSELVNKLAGYRNDVDKETPADLSGKTLECITRKGYQVPDKDAFLRTPNPSLLGIPFGQQETGPEEVWAPEQKPGTVQVGPAIPARRYIPTAQETDFAAAWFQCDQETKRVDTLITTAMKVQQDYLERYQTQFDELNPQVEAVAKRAAELAAK